MTRWHTVNALELSVQSDFKIRGSCWCVVKPLRQNMQRATSSSVWRMHGVWVQDFSWQKLDWMFVYVRVCFAWRCLKDTWPSMNSGSIEVSFLINARPHYSQPLGSYFYWRRPQGPPFFSRNKSPRPPFCGLAIGSGLGLQLSGKKLYVHALHFPCTSSRCLTFWTWEVCLSAANRSTFNCHSSCERGNSCWIVVEDKE